MKLSEAIRLGALLHPQCFDTMVLHNDSGSVVGTCALGAAAEAGFKLHTVDILLRSKITRLNDRAGWTRERIADWVESFEPTLPLESPVSPATDEPDRSVVVVPVVLSGTELSTRAK